MGQSGRAAGGSAEKAFWWDIAFDGVIWYNNSVAALVGSVLTDMPHGAKVLL